MRLYIAEKPSMAREIAMVLKNPQQAKGYIKTAGGVVTWLFGHVLKQVDPEVYDAKYHKWVMEDLPIIPKQWKLEVDPHAAEQFYTVKNLIAHADEIIHAGDPDREGQLLVDEVLDFVGNKKPVKRILLNALDETSIRRANSNLRDNQEFFNLKQSALARSRADWLIGMNLSRAYTLAARKLGHRDIVFPIGRVKTPTLALVVRREREITDFKPVDFFSIRALFNHENGNFLAQWKPSEDLFNQPNETVDADGKILSPTAFDSEGRLINKNVAEDFVKKFSAAPLEGKIASYKTAEKKESQPLPFSLSSLQIAAGKAFGYTPQEVLDAAQSLYEKKFTTYPRSDCEFLPTTQFKDAEKILSHLQKTGEENLQQLVTHADASIQSRAWNDKKISAHHAIIPTLKPMTGGVSATEQNIYNLIAKNYAVQFYPLHIYDETTVEVSYKDETFTARGKVVKQIGWREFYVATKAKSEDEIELLPKMKEGDKVDYKEAELKKSTTKPPVRFTASSLVQGMKDIHKYVKNPESKKQLKDVYGIGTEATRATIIEDLIKRGFLKFMAKSKKNLQPTEKAFMLIDALPDEMTYPDATAIWEDKLHSMSEGDGTLDEFLAGQIKFTIELVAKAENAEIKMAEGTFLCPVCKSAMRKIPRNNGGVFWGCSNYPECKFTCDDDKGKPIFESTETFHCPQCEQGIMIKRKGKNGVFWSCNNYPECKFACDDDKGKPIFESTETFHCPQCEQGIMIKRKGKNGVFWSCNNYPECKFACADKDGKPIFESTGVFHCPTCGSGIMVKRRGKFGEFWSCNNYPECKTSFNDYEGKPDFEGKKKSAGTRNFGNKNYGNRNYKRRSYKPETAPFNPDDFFGPDDFISSRNFR